MQALPIIGSVWEFTVSTVFWPVLLGMLLFACLGSFAWSMRNFFVRPAKLTAGLRVTLLAAFVFACLHVVAIFTTDTYVTQAALVGCVSYVLALVIFWWAIAVNRKRPLAACFSEREQLHLVEQGPYRYIRHPFYCSYLLTWFAGAIATLNFGLALTVLAMLALYIIAAQSEEKKFADSPLRDYYAEYQRHTGQFIPKFWKLRALRRS
jgi:protein-S-isoprenylcysteine O-methyltransferase Ste14